MKTRRQLSFTLTGGRRLGAALAALMALGVGERAAQALTCTWNTTSSTTFGSGTNWSCGRIPNSSDDVFFDATNGANHSCSLSSNISVNSITFQNAYSQTFTSGTHTVTVAGAWTMSTGSFVGGSGNITIGGNLTMTGGTFTGGSGTTTVTGSVNASVAMASGSDPSLVGYWNLDDTASPALDSSGNGNNLTWSGTPTTPASHPSAITFADPRSLAMTGGQYAASAVLSGISVLQPSTLTVSAWYKATSTDTNGSALLDPGQYIALGCVAIGCVLLLTLLPTHTRAASLSNTLAEPTAKEHA